MLLYPVFTQNKELEEAVRRLQDQRDQASKKADLAEQDILNLLGELTAAEEKKRSLRNQLAKVGPARFFCILERYVLQHIKTAVKSPGRES